MKYTWVSSLHTITGTKVFIDRILYFISLIYLCILCRHNDSIQCVAYNPVTHQLASCSSGDFGKCVCVCVCACACARVCVCAHARACVHLILDGSVALLINIF